MPFPHPIQVPCWVRIVRTPHAGSSPEFSGFISLDGHIWQQVGTSVTFPMLGTALVGMAVTSHSDEPNDHLQDLCVAVIDRVTMQSSSISGQVNVITRR